VAHVARRIVALRDGLVVEDTTEFAKAMQALQSSDLVEPADQE
jgi:hypothetical protein